MSENSNANELLEMEDIAGSSSKRGSTSTLPARSTRARQAAMAQGQSSSRSSANERQLLVLLSRLTLQNSKHVRETDAALQHVVLRKSEHSVCTAMQQCGKKYFEERNGNKNP
eukprot:5730229-Heterocapsa_arctica.AAC.1